MHSIFIFLIRWVGDSMPKKLPILFFSKSNDLCSHNGWSKSRIGHNEHLIQSICSLIQQYSAFTWLLHRMKLQDYLQSLCWMYVDIFISGVSRIFQSNSWSGRFSLPLTYFLCRFHRRSKGQMATKMIYTKYLCYWEPEKYVFSLFSFVFIDYIIHYTVSCCSTKKMGAGVSQFPGAHKYWLLDEKSNLRSLC